MTRTVRVYFDFVSPYSYLALTRLAAFGARHGVAWEPVPIFYAALLDAHHLVGPAESLAKRRYTMTDVLRAAELLGVPLVGPPAHPFRSLEALRVATLFAGDPRALELSVSLSMACWAEGRDLTDWDVLADVVGRSGIDAGDLAVRASAPAVKDALRDRTRSTIEAGVFGVPTFELDGELFWGNDRLDHLAARLDGGLPDLSARASILENRPRGSDRPGAPILGEVRGG
ncbi:MAG TPA: 2-hydroxychromene-2-carboxylate isomerase [Gemmatimonadota bacterium]|nr:2-hydroxychromene-2-carboxylate isomerase [Gemmatimonadota bacterium]